PLGMTNNEESVGHYFQAIWDAGGAVPLAGDMGILAQISALPNYADALNHMTPAAYATAIAGEQSNAQDFADNMMSCHGQSAERTAISEEDCSWVELSAGQRKQSATIAADPSSYHNTRFQFGRQQHLNQDWLIGGALGYDNWNGTTDSLGSTSGQDFRRIGRQISRRRLGACSGSDRRLRKFGGSTTCHHSGSNASAGPYEHASCRPAGPQHLSGRCRRALLQTLCRSRSRLFPHERLSGDGRRCPQPPRCRRRQIRGIAFADAGSRHGLRSV